MSREVNDAQGAAPVTHGDAATEPIDLAQAFKALNQINREAAQGDVGDAEDGEPGVEDMSGEPGEPVGEGQVVREGEGYEAAPASDQQGGGGYDDGSSSGIEAIDFNAYKQDLLREVQQNAVSQIRREFDEQNIGYYTAGELTIRDEQTGRVMFRNPDVQDERDPNYYFSSRSEMQQFIEAWNKSVDFEFRRAVNEKQQELMLQAAPKARLADFLPKWQGMSKEAKAVFDELLEGHEIRDSQGKEIGFDVNLDVVAAQAEKIASKFSGKPKAAQEAAQNVEAEAGGPAFDIPTGNGESADAAEPKTIGEALKILDDEKTKGKR